MAKKQLSASEQKLKKMAVLCMNTFASKTDVMTAQQATALFNSVFHPSNNNNS